MAPPSARSAVTVACASGAPVGFVTRPTIAPTLGSAAHTCGSTRPRRSTHSERRQLLIFITSFLPKPAECCAHGHVPGVRKATYLARSPREEAVRNCRCLGTRAHHAAE